MQPRWHPPRRTSVYNVWSRLAETEPLTKLPVVLWVPVFHWESYPRVPAMDSLVTSAYHYQQRPPCRHLLPEKRSPWFHLHLMETFLLTSPVLVSTVT